MSCLYRASSLAVSGKILTGAVDSGEESVMMHCGSELRLLAGEKDIVTCWVFDLDTRSSHPTEARVLAWWGCSCE